MKIYAKNFRNVVQKFRNKNENIFYYQKLCAKIKNCVGKIQIMFNFHVNIKTEKIIDPPLAI